MDYQEIEAWARDRSPTAIKSAGKIWYTRAQALIAKTPLPDCPFRIRGVSESHCYALEKAVITTSEIPYHPRLTADNIEAHAREILEDIPKIEIRWDCIDDYETFELAREALIRYTTPIPDESVYFYPNGGMK